MKVKKQIPIISPDPIEHVVLLMLENCSYDRMLGALFAPTPDRCNNDINGATYRQQETKVAQVEPDPRHEMRDVLFQIADQNDNFVRDYSIYYPESTTAQRQDIMGFYPAGFLRSLHTLAESFTVCDRWFSSVPGPTWPNRLFALSGTSKGRVLMPESIDELNLHLYNQTTLFDRLNQSKIGWKVYFGDAPLSLLFTHQWQSPNLRRYMPMSQFEEDAAGPASEFPSFCFVEPRYLGNNANDDHPDHDVRAGEALIASVYNALRRNEELFASTLLVVTFDEHGGFYDRLSPPGTIAPDDHHEEYDFSGLGVRVPTLLVSPYSAAKRSHQVFDHTSLLKYLIDKWKLGHLGKRAAAANSIGPLLRKTPRPDDELPSSLRVPRLRLRAENKTPLSDYERSLVLLGRYLEQRLEGRPGLDVQRAEVPSPDDERRETVARIQSFISSSQ